MRIRRAVTAVAGLLLAVGLVGTRARRLPSRCRPPTSPRRRSSQVPLPRSRAACAGCRSGVLLAALQVDRVQRDDLRDGRALQPGPGRRRLQAAGGDAVGGDASGVRGGGRRCRPIAGCVALGPACRPGLRRGGSGRGSFFPGPHHPALQGRATPSDTPRNCWTWGSTCPGLGIDYLCPSSATPFVPYFHSGLDALAWRWSIPRCSIRRH
jgi:hypothetical protein